MTKAINVGIWLFALLSIGMGIQAAFFPHEGHPASMVSLYAAGGVGVLFIVSYFLWTKNPRAGRIMSLVLCLLCLGRFVPAFIKTKDMYPAGITALLALILFIMLGAGHMMAQKSKTTEA